MKQILIDFIKLNKDLIAQNTKQSWEQLYEKINDSSLLTFQCGNFTAAMHKAGIYPEKFLGYLPYRFLADTTIMSYRLPKEVTEIGNNAFENCYDLKIVYIHGDVTEIADDAFYYCYELTDCYFGGTMDEWVKVTNNKYIFPNSENTCTIHCTDGKFVDGERQ